MSGHSKWSQIKHKKAVTDKRKGKLFSKLANLIAIAARAGGDPIMNPNLRLKIDRAKQAGMAKEAIDRAIKRGTGELSGALLEEVRYEAYGPAGVAFLIDCVTDNKNRTINDIRAILNKNEAKFAQAGALDYLFEPRGVVMLVKGQQTKATNDEIQLAAIEAGAQDFDEDDDSLTIYTQPDQLESVKQALESVRVVIDSAELTMIPKTSVVLSQQALGQKVLNLAQALDELDDVIAVSSNFELSEAVRLDQDHE